MVIDTLAPFAPEVPHSLGPFGYPDTAKLAFSYARKSNKNDVAVEDQHHVNAQKAADDGYVIPTSPAFRFSDDFVSGETESRNALDRLRRAITTRATAATRLYVNAIPRLVRADELTFFPSLVYEMNKHGVELYVTCRTPTLVTYNLAKSVTAPGQFVTDMVTGMNGALERHETRRRILTGVRHRIRRGFFTGKEPFATERYIADSLTGAYLGEAATTGSLHLPHAAFKLRWSDTLLPWVRYIFDQLERGASMRAVAEALNAKAVPTALSKATHLKKMPKWCAESVLHVATNPIYKGDLKWGYIKYRGVVGEEAETATSAGDGPLLHHGFMPSPPISASQWDRVQQALKARTAKNGPRDRAGVSPFLLTGRIRCAECGAPFTGHRGAMRRRVDRKQYYRHGRAPAGYAGRCPYAFRFFRAEAIDGAVLRLLEDALAGDRLQQLANSEVARQLAEARHSASPKALDRLRRRQAEIQAAADRASDRIARASSHEECASFERTLGRLVSELEQVARQVDALASQESEVNRIRGLVAKPKDRLADVRALVASANPVERRLLVQAVVPSISLDVSKGEMLARVRAC